MISDMPLTQILIMSPLPQLLQIIRAYRGNLTVCTLVYKNLSIDVLREALAFSHVVLRNEDLVGLQLCQCFMPVPKAMEKIGSGECSTPFLVFHRILPQLGKYSILHLT